MVSQLDKSHYSIKNLKFLIILMVIAMSCSHGNEINEIEKQKLIKTDEDFSKMSFQRSMKDAFIYYSAEDVILMRENNDPIVGQKSLIDLYKSIPSDSIKLTWTPVKAEVDGRLGYTFGNWERKIADTGRIERGTYITVWKKQEDGTWRFILDAGNEGKKE